MCKVEVVARTFEKNNDNLVGFDPEILQKDLQILSGRAAGICYMPDDYLSNNIHDEIKALSRAQFNAKSGHYSVYEHAHVSFIIECSKAVAMVLNSTRLYSTSEKSARYTFMRAETELENTLYNKWKNIFIKIIDVYYNKILDTKDVEKLAMENARYMISVFTNTTMEFTVPYGRAILLCGWLDDFARYLDEVVSVGDEGIYSAGYKLMGEIYYKRLSKEIAELADNMRATLNIDKDNPLLKDHKGMGITFLSDINAMRVKESIKMSVPSVENSEKKNYYGDVYISSYKASFASVAQLQRHRTLDLFVMVDPSVNCYIPDLIKSTPYESEWIEDFGKLVKNGICPQSVILNVTESGRFEDFNLKCKERLCTRAQYETMRIVQYQVEEFATYSGNLSPLNRLILRTMIDEQSKLVNNRCRFSGYCCKEPCKFVKYGYIRNV